MMALGAGVEIVVAERVVDLLDDAQGVARHERHGGTRPLAVLGVPGG